MDPHVAFQRRPNLTIALGPSGFLDVHIGTKRVRIPPVGLRILDHFSRPSTIGEAMASFGESATGGLDMLTWLQALLAMVEAGALVSAAECESLLPSSRSGFDSVAIHARMVADETRTNAFLAAVRSSVKNGDVVVDIGSGTGILALAAAQAGARKVYAIEAGHVAAVAAKLFSASGVDDVVETMRGFSFGVDLQERADVLVGEILGNDAFGEDIVPVFEDARRRFLKPGARVIPARIRLYAFPARAPGAFVRRETFAAAEIARLSRLYRLDLRPLREAVRKSTHAVWVHPSIVRRWPMIAEPIPVFDVRLDEECEAPTTSEVVFHVGSANVNAVCLFFEAELGSGIHISTSPLEVGAGCNWSLVTWMVQDWPVENGRAAFRFVLEDRRVVRLLPSSGT